MDPARDDVVLSRRCCGRDRIIDRRSTRVNPICDSDRHLLIHGVEVVGRGARLRVDTGGEEPIVLATAVCPHLAAGDDIDDADFLALVEASADYDAREAALRLLAYRPRSQGELRERLVRKGIDAPRVDRCLAAMKDAGFLDDAAYAEAHVRDAVRLKPRGSRRLLSELRRKGVAEATAADAVDRVLTEEESPDVALAVRAAETWMRRSGDAARGHLRGTGDRTEVERARRRFWGYMSRRGFGPDAIRGAMETICR